VAVGAGDAAVELVDVGGEAGMGALAVRAASMRLWNSIMATSMPWHLVQ